MSLKNPPDVVKKPRPIPADFTDYYDLAYEIAHQYNTYASLSDKMPLLDEEWVREALPALFPADLLDLLCKDPESRALIGGRLGVLYEMEMMPHDEADIEDEA